GPPGGIGGAPGGPPTPLIAWHMKQPLTTTCFLPAACGPDSVSNCTGAPPGGPPGGPGGPGGGAEAVVGVLGLQPTRRATRPRPASHHSKRCHCATNFSFSVMSR